MILWGRPSSVNVQKVLWALDETGLSAENKVVGGPYGGLDDPDFAALTPVRRIPVLQDGDWVIWESNAVLRYLARRQGALGDGNPQVDMWMEFGSTTLQPPFTVMFWQRVRLSPQDRDARKEAEHVANLRRALALLDRALGDGRTYLAGETFSVADIALGSLFYRITDVAPDILDDCPGVAGWHDRLTRRAGYQQRVRTSYEELRYKP